MRVLLISTNRERLPDPVAPLGAAYVAGALARAGHEVRLLDLLFVPDIAVAVRDAYVNFRPRVTGLSIRNVDNVAFPESVSYIPDIVTVAGTLKAQGARVIVAGGSGFTIMPGELLERIGLELGITGEGEDAFPELLRRIEHGLPVNTMPGLAYRYNGCVIINPPVPVARLDTSTEPLRGLIDNAAYMAEGGSGNLQTKRGCRFGCCYCTYPIVEGSRVRLRAPASCAEEFVRGVRQYGIKHFFIVDNVFNYPPSHAKKFCRELIARGAPAGWSCYVNPAYLDHELAELMARSGCRGVEFGSDSAVDSVLGALGKGFRVKDVVDASAVCRDAGLKFCHSLMLASPGETNDTLVRTLDVMDKLGPNAVIAMLGIRIFPGTKLEDIAAAEGVVVRGGIGLEPKFYFSPGLDIDKASEVLAGYGKSHANFIMPGFHLRMTDKIRTTLRSHGFIGPLWEYMNAGAGRAG